MSRSLPIALMQLPSNPSLDEFAIRVKEVVEQFPATELLVFPELHLTNAADGFTESGPRAVENEPLDGPRSRRIGEIAKKHGVWLIPGSVLENDGGTIFNTLPVYSPEGELVTSYRKIFPWRPYEKVRPGNRIVYFDIPGRGRIGLTICYDAWFPEIHRQLAWFGCEAIINVVLTPTIDREQELVLARANAIVNQVFVASVNAATPSAVGQSLVVDPEGRVRSRAAAAESCVITDVLHLGLVEEIRERGTAGLNCLWKQFEAGDEPLELPVYEGRISPDTWTPRTS
ncbi:carbon-nitrogen hydrolase family protein [Leucobacter sp. CSA1]|uniref:Carbon-nitrogen hydrolase family protein n=1 Tax=Leucobacter chromiisoli TaxID=2796471 RepID=A0A934QBJ6_9MICO|nr:carbon-nitrogen hydrolase family protein [Leucobacter chromiisoli]MBK0420067.1 carbon-nitrogen hydrolase family protein [Leucobacter chromiisoli]